MSHQRLIAQLARPAARFAHTFSVPATAASAPAALAGATRDGLYQASNASHLAVVSRSSEDHADARRRALSLYRLWLRKADEIIALYYLDVPSQAIRQRVRQEFEKTRHVSDLGTLDVMLWKGQVDLQETLNLWKQKTHLMRFFEQAEFGDAKKAPFMDKFLAGRH
ncbi:hypothetical protein BC828DRAFT_390181 [Blastocladiella britannica]|nr:hypothetical protein BC828DRAFT_390181 [Blastocladiella britannica]